MLAYIGVNGAGLPAAAGVGVTPVANPDNYPALGAGQPLTVADPSKGVIANDSSVYGVTLLTQATNGTSRSIRMEHSLHTQFGQHGRHGLFQLLRERDRNPAG